MTLLGTALGVGDQAMCDRLQTRLARVQKAVSIDTKRPRMLGFESVCPLVASGQWLPDMRLRAGADDALGGVPGSPARIVTLKEVGECAAEVVVISCCGRSA